MSKGWRAAYDNWKIRIDRLRTEEPVRTMTTDLRPLLQNMPPTTRGITLYQDNMLPSGPGVPAMISGVIF
jgi:hypothetical protein